MGDFSATVKDWVLKSKAAQEAVMKSSIEDLIVVVQAGAPVDTGFLKNSAVSEINGDGVFPATKPATKGDNGVDPSGEIGLTIESMDVGDDIRVAFTAAYARRVNSGFTGTDSLGRNYEQGGAHFVELGAADWQAIVEANVDFLKA